MHNNIDIVFYCTVGSMTIQKATKGTLVEIKPAKRYTLADLDYTNTKSRVYREHNSASSPMVSKVRPKISNINQIK